MIRPLMDFANPETIFHPVGQSLLNPKRKTLLGTRDRDESLDVSWGREREVEGGALPRCHDHRYGGAFQAVPVSFRSQFVRPRQEAEEVRTIAGGHGGFHLSRIVNWSRSDRGPPDRTRVGVEPRSFVHETCDSTGYRSVVTGTLPR